MVFRVQKSEIAKYFPPKFVEKSTKSGQRRTTFRIMKIIVSKESILNLAEYRLILSRFRRIIVNYRRIIVNYR